MMKRTWIKAAVILLIGLALLAAAIILLNRNDDDQYQQKRGTMSQGFGELKTIEWQGDTYRQKPAVTTILVAGIDKPDAVANTDASDYRSGGQADFLMLVAIDKTDKQIHRLQIDRDTMTEIDILGVFGNEVGTRVQQICLSHAFGAAPEDNAKYTLRAVRNLLGGMDIDGYYMIDYAAMPVLNDALGGVTVKMEYDMTSVNPAWTKGSTVTLHGKDAELFVRSRMTVGQGTNYERMFRQAEYMTSAIAKMKQRIANDLSFGEGLLKTLSSVSVTNMTQKRLISELNEAYGFEYLPVDHPEGEYTIGDDGFVEFHMKENSAVEWVLGHLYTKQ